MNNAGSEPRLFIPALQPLYDRAVSLNWALVRFAVGWNLVIHAWFKILRGGPGATLGAFSQMGFEPAALYAYGSFCVEGLAGVGLILGLFTRFFAAAAAIEMLVIFCAYWSTGFPWLSRGYEYVLLWGMVSFAIALRGGGPYSLDRKLGVEL
jgi:putative oxidoreductase